MKQRQALLLSTLVLSLLAGGCATTPDSIVFDSAARAPASRVEYGRIEAIEVYRHGESQPVNVGILLGGLAGGVIGHQIGSGTGNTVATVGGAIAGAVVGNEIEKRHVEGERYRIYVRLDSGATLSVEETRDFNLRVGDRVRVENNRIHRA